MVKVLPPPKPNLPEPVPGMAISVAPAGHVRWLEDYEYYDQLGRDPLQQARIWLIKDDGERVEKLKAVLEQYPKKMHHRNMLFEAALRGDEALVRHFVESGLKVHPDISKSKSEEEERAIQEAKENGEILDHDDPTAVPVHAAAVRGHVGCLRIFLEEGKVDVDVRDAIGQTPLIAGAEHPDVVRYLLGLGADPTARTLRHDQLPADKRDQQENADALTVAAAHGKVESVRLLLEHPFHGSTRKRKSRQGEEPGVWVTPAAVKAAAGAEDGFEALHLLLERGAYPMEARDGKTKAELLSDEERQCIVDATPNAAMDGPLESLRLLLSYQYPVDLDGNLLPFEVPEDLHRPFVWGAYGAMSKNRVDKFEFINSFGIREHDAMSLSELPAGQNLNIQSLLERAAEAGAMDCARLLIEKYGANPDSHRVPPGVKPLYLAAGNNQLDMVRFLVEEHRADIHLGSGRYATSPTPLHSALALKSFECIDYLLKRGGPVDHVDDEIRSVDKPMTVVLKSDWTVKSTGPAVHLVTRDSAEDYLHRFANDWQTLNPPFVLLEIGPDDSDWIGRLQPRRSPEELRESGPNARELNREERVPSKDLGSNDPRSLMVAIPTIQARQDMLNNDDDLIPEFRPFLVPAKNDDSD